MTCKCVFCGECDGMGTVWRSFSGKYLGNRRCDDLDELEMNEGARLEPDEERMIIGRTQACEFIGQLEAVFKIMADANRKYGQKQAADAFDECALMLEEKIEDFARTK